MATRPALRAQVIVWWLAGSALLVVSPACTATVVPPSAPADPVRVLLLDHGHTSSLMVPGARGELVRWAYGDWRYYALGEKNVATALAALFLPTRGALGRKPLGTDDSAVALAELRVGVENVHAVEVGRAGAEHLNAELAALFDEQVATLLYNHASDLWFVHHPSDYSCLHNSNHCVAGWLRVLGCEVKGPTFAARWRVASPAECEGSPADE